MQLTSTTQHNKQKQTNAKHTHKTKIYYNDKTTSPTFLVCCCCDYQYMDETHKYTNITRQKDLQGKYFRSQYVFVLPPATSSLRRDSLNKLTYLPSFLPTVLFLLVTLTLKPSLQLVHLSFTYIFFIVSVVQNERKEATEDDPFTSCSGDDVLRLLLRVPSASSSQ